MPTAGVAAPGFLLAQIAGAGIGAALATTLYPHTDQTATVMTLRATDNTDDSADDSADDQAVLRPITPAQFVVARAATASLDARRARQDRPGGHN